MGNNAESRVTVWMSEALTEDVDDNVDWRYSSRSEWVREACEWRLTLSQALERRGIELPEDADEREAMIEDIAHAGVASFATDD